MTKEKLARIEMIKGVDATSPKMAHNGDVGTDLFTAEDVVIPPTLLSAPLVTTDLKLAFNEEEYGMMITPRSGILNWPLILSNCVGIVEGTYRGSVGMAFHNIYSGPIGVMPFALTLNPETKEMEQVPLEDISAGALTKAKERYSKELNIMNMGIKEESELFVSSLPNGTVFIPKGTRLVQAFLFNKVDSDWVPVGALSDTVRGTGGFGSSGTK